MPPLITSVIIGAGSTPRSPSSRLARSNHSTDAPWYSSISLTHFFSFGAEIIADGSIHVYAALNGRALAGASGNAEARIFALQMAPELVSIAGVYRTFEDGFPAELARLPAQIRLAGDRIDIHSMSAAGRG